MKKKRAFRFPKRAYYILDNDHRTVEVDLLTWGAWFEEIENRRVGHTVINDHCFVSTVFLGIDHRFSGDGPPLLFETMIFDGPDYLNEDRRYASWDDAEIGHEAAVKKVLAAMKAKAKVKS